MLWTEFSQEPGALIGGCNPQPLRRIKKSRHYKLTPGPQLSRQNKSLGTKTDGKTMLSVAKQN